MSKAALDLRFLANLLLVVPSVVQFGLIVTVCGGMSLMLMLVGLVSFDVRVVLGGGLFLLICWSGGKALLSFLDAWRGFGGQGSFVPEEMRDAVGRASGFAILPLLVSLSFAGAVLEIESPLAWILAFYLSGAGLIAPLIWMAISGPPARDQATPNAGVPNA